MDKGSKILISTAVILLIASISITYYRFFVAKNYIAIDSQGTDLPK